MQTPERDTFHLSDLYGKVVVFNFWFMDCPPCIQEIPELNKLVERFEEKEVEFIAIGRDSPERLKNEFLPKNQFRYTVVSSEKQSGIYCIFQGYPTHMVVDKTGVVKFIANGYTSAIESKMIKCIEDSLK